MVNALIHEHTQAINRLPRSLLIGAKTLSGRPPERIDIPEALVHEVLGIRQVNADCVELTTYGNSARNVYASFIGISIVMSLFLSIGILNIIPEPLSWRIVLAQITACSAFIGMAVLMYLCMHNLLGKFRGGFIRIHRGTRKLYFVTPRDERLLTLDWDALQALAGYIPILSAAGYTSRYPLYLIATDWTQSPPKEICVSCGNLGWRDDGDSARQLWDYLQTFMEHGQSNLPKPPPIPPRLSRKQTFLRFYRNWAEKFRRDLATPKGKRWAPLLIPAKILALICIVFPDSLAEFIEYNVPYTSFPKEIDELCGFADPLAPVTRACT